MVRSRTQLVWALAACAAVGAQIAPKALCQACDQPCCAGEVGGHVPHTTASRTEPTGGCPLCASTVDHPVAETSERPCHCQLDVRHDQPLSPSRGPLPACGDEAAVAALAFVPPVVPPVLGVSREYVAASLAVPIRPPRILFGVWRN